ncbi:MAG: ECF transporter S component [Clostridiales bacterium]|nr:ECF transporter S component [Clostridiales bacterium]
MQTKRIAFSAIFCALIFVATAFIKVPVAIGYFNLGDAFLLISAVCCGPFGGAIGGMIGCALADVIGGYAVYAPFTFVVKGVEGLICGLLFLMIKRNEKGYFLRTFAAFIVSLLWMVAGYFITNWILYGIGEAVSVGLPCDFLQAGLSLVVASLIFTALANIPYVVRTFNLKGFEEPKKDEKDAK